MRWIALRPDFELVGHNREGVELDDVVVEAGISMFRAEFMADNQLWVRLYFEDGDAMDFSVFTPRAKMRMVATVLPGGFEDWDNK